MKSWFPQPVLVRQTGNSCELALVITDHGVAEGEGVGSNQEIVAADRSASPFEACPKRAVGGVCRRLERDDLQCAEYSVQLGG